MQYLTTLKQLLEFYISPTKLQTQTFKKYVCIYTYIF